MIWLLWFHDEPEYWIITQVAAAVTLTFQCTASWDKTQLAKHGDITLQKLWLELTFLVGLYGFGRHFSFWESSFRSARWHAPMLPELLSNSEGVFDGVLSVSRGLAFRAWLMWFHFDYFQQCGQLLVPMVSLPSNQFPSDHLHADTKRMLSGHLTIRGWGRKLTKINWMDGSMMDEF